VARETALSLSARFAASAGCLLARVLSRGTRRPREPMLLASAALAPDVAAESISFRTDARFARRLRRLRGDRVHASCRARRMGSVLPEPVSGDRPLAPGLS